MLAGTSEPAPDVAEMHEDMHTRLVVAGGTPKLAIWLPDFKLATGQVHLGGVVQLCLARCSGMRSGSRNPDMHLRTRSV